MDPKPDKLKNDISLNFRHLEVTTKQKVSFCIISLKTFTELNYHVLNRLLAARDFVCIGVASATKGKVSFQCSICD